MYSCSPVSQSEKLFIEQGCLAGVRYDGREPFDFRAVRIENDIFPQVNGSSRVKIGSTIEIVCSIKAEVLETNLFPIKENLIDISVEICPSSSIYMDIKDLQLESAKYASILERSKQIELLIFKIDKIKNRTFLESNAVDCNELIIIPEKFHWCLQIDIIIFQSDGAPIDACSLSVYAALKYMRIPKVEIVVLESGLMEDFEVIGDLSEGRCISLQNMPIFVTIAKIRSIIVVDSTGAEQSCASCVVSICMDRMGNCCGVHYIKGGLLTCEELLTIITQCNNVATAILFQLDSVPLTNREIDNAIN